MMVSDLLDVTTGPTGIAASEDKDRYSDGLCGRDPAAPLDIGEERRRTRLGRCD